MTRYGVTRYGVTRYGVTRSKDFKREIDTQIETETDKLLVIGDSCRFARGNLILTF